MVKTLCNNNPDKMDKLNLALMQTIFKDKFTDSEFRIILETGVIPIQQLQTLIGCEPESVLHVLYTHYLSLEKNSFDENLSIATKTIKIN